MHLKTIKANAIRTLSEALKEVLLETNMHFDENGIRILRMDQGKSAFVHLKLNADKFDEYYCPSPISIGINLTSLHKLLKTINNSDIITLFIAKGDEEKLGIKIENHEKKIISVSRLKLIDLDNEGYNIPSTKFETIYTMQCIDFQKHCRDLSMISDYIDIWTKNNGDTFTMVASGDFAEQEIEIGESSPENLNATEPVFIGRYQVKFLNLFCKSSGMCPTVEIFLKENFPMILIYSVANLGNIKLGLSPKVIT
jgi:proliferating cell nuclear antigen PCNA